MANDLYNLHLRFVTQLYAALVEARVEHRPLCWIESHSVAYA